MNDLYDKHQYHRAFDCLQNVLRHANGFFQLCEPWKKIGFATEAPSLNTCLCVVYESARLVSLMLKPIVPSVASTALDRLGVPLAERTAKFAHPFDRCNPPMYGRPMPKQRKVVFERVDLPPPSQTTTPPLIRSSA